MRTILLLTLLAAIDPTKARQAFEEMEAMCRADGGKLWGTSLCGPMVFAEPQTREAIRTDGSTKPVPQNIGIANTAVEWDGARWTMLVWPLPEETFARRTILAHESFHRVQEQLGYKQHDPSNRHLDDAAGRYWLRLEWRALAKALETKSKSAVADALLFRAKRRDLIAEAAEQERLLEIHEGLAEYTGTALAEPKVAKRAPHVVDKLRRADKGEGFMRGFAYTSGPAWGAVIELRDPKWTRTLKPADDLGALASRAWRLTAKGDAEARALAYDGAALRIAENERAARRQAERAALRARFIDGPLLILPLGSFQMVMDPNGLQPLDDHGTVHRTLEIRDAWGKIVIPSGAMITSDFKRLVVPANGEHTLTLNEGWAKVAGKREGDWTVEKK